MKKLLVLAAMTATLVLGAIAPTTSASVPTHPKPTPYNHENFAVLYLPNGQQCMANTNPICTFYVSRDGIGFGVVGSNANDGWFDYYFCGYLYGYGDWCPPPNSSPLWENASLSIVVETYPPPTISWTAYARQKCPVSGGYHFSDFKHLTLAPAENEVMWGNLRLNSSCQNSPSP